LYQTVILQKKRIYEHICLYIFLYEKFCTAILCTSELTFAGTSGIPADGAEQAKAMVVHRESGRLETRDTHRSLLVRAIIFRENMGNPPIHIHSGLLIAQERWPGVQLDQGLRRGLQDHLQAEVHLSRIGGGGKRR